MMFLYSYLFAIAMGGVLSMFDYSHGQDRRLKIDFKQY